MTKLFSPCENYQMPNNIFSDDFVDFIEALNIHHVNYVLIGGYSVILHGYHRSTGDLDIWIEPSPENYHKLVIAFAHFGMPMFDMTEEKFLNDERYDVFTFGRPPVCIDLLSKVKGLSFKETFDNAIYYDITESIKVRFLHLNDLITAKKASGRHKDLDDIEHLSQS